MTWTDVQNDKFSTRYFKRIQALSEFKTAIENSVDVLAKSNKGEVIVIKFEAETSLIYIYPCLKNNINDETEVQIKIQLVPFFDYFDKIESKWYQFGDVYDSSFKKILNDFYELFTSDIIGLFRAKKLSCEFYAYGHGDDKERTVVVEKLGKYIEL